MSLEKKLEELASKQKAFSKYCAYKMVLDSMPEKDIKSLEAAWERGLSANIIVKALRAEGYKTTPESIRHHRKGMCKCPK